MKYHVPFTGHKFSDAVGKFWVVTKATKHSELTDIFFKTDVGGMMLQAHGGLYLEDVLLLTRSRASALRAAKKELARMKIPGAVGRRICGSYGD